MEKLVTPDALFWRGKKVLLTGHTGFKGSWLTLWLNRLGAKVTGFSLPPHTTPSLFDLAQVAQECSSEIGDIRDTNTLQALVAKTRPDIIFHLAAQALVRPSYADPLATYATNVQGTANLLDAMRAVDSVKLGIFITTDKVYRNREWAYPYREDDQLGGHDPYSASKAASELIIASYRDAFLDAKGVAIASARAGNVIGGGDWSPDRIVPDAIRAWQNNLPLEIRNPGAIRPWQHVLEPLAGYLLLAERLWDQPSLAGAWNFGPSTSEMISVRELMTWAGEHFPAANTIFGQNTENLHEANWLALEIVKARQQLDWHPNWGAREAIGRTMAWYRALKDGAHAQALCAEDIDAYEQLPP